VALVALLACGDPPGASLEPMFGKSGTGPTVTATSPDTAVQDTTLDVQVSGSGFDAGSQAQWLLNGVADPRVRTNSTRYVSRSSLIANITIAIDAVPASYDVAVTTSTGKKGIGTELFVIEPRDPTATWKIPLADAGLGFASDGLKGDGTYSVYANGVCGVTGKIFATASGSNTGDATIQTSKVKNCTRRFTLRYPDASESVLSFNNLLQLENTQFSIPVGTHLNRRLIVNPGAITNNPSRCGRLLFGVNGTVGPGSDSVTVTRIDASTWQVQSQAAPNNHAYCENNGQLYPMPVSFIVVSSSPVP
jgi:hypothetical protein